MKLSKYLNRELGLTIEGGCTPSFVQFDLAVARALNSSKSKEMEEVEFEDFSLKMDKHTEPEIRKK